MRSNAILFATVCAMLPWSARGQVTTSSIYGSVTDSTGGVVAGATVTLTNAGTGAEAAKVTDPDGSFVFDFVRVGTYRLKISAPGLQGARDERYRSPGRNRVCGAPSPWTSGR